MSDKDEFHPNDWEKYLDKHFWHPDCDPHVYGYYLPLDVVSYNLGFEDGCDEGYSDMDILTYSPHDESYYVNNAPSWINKEAFDCGYQIGLGAGALEQ